MGESSSIKGLRKNMFNILDGQHNIHDNATLIDESNAKDGVVAAVKGPNKPIIDTGYYEMNELVGLHQLKIRWFSNLTSGNGLVVQYWKKDADGNESHTDFPVSISATVGNIGETFGNSADKLYFSPNYQYRIKVISAPSISDANYVSVDFIGLLPINEWNVSTSYVLADSGGPRLLSFYPSYRTVTSNGSTTGIVHFAYNSEEGALPFLGNNGNVTIQTTVTSSNNSCGWIANVVNDDENGFDIVVSCTAGAWTGACGVMIEIIGYIPVTVL